MARRRCSDRSETTLVEQEATVQRIPSQLDPQVPAGQVGVLVDLLNAVDNTRNRLCARGRGLACVALCCAHQRTKEVGRVGTNLLVSRQPNKSA